MRQQSRPQVLDPLPGQRRDRDHRRLRKRGFRQQNGQRGRDLRNTVTGDVGLGQRHHRAIDPQQRQNVQMFAGLRPDALGQSHHQQRRIDAAGPRQHSMHEPLVPRHIDEAEVTRIRVSQVDGDAAPLFLGQTVGINTGQGFDQCRLAMVHMAGGADDHRKTRVACMSVRVPLARPLSSRSPPHGLRRRSLAG